jgi:hypothetical protein
MRRPLSLALALLCACHGPPSTPTPSAEAPAPLRRLTNSQYLNSLRDLFGEEQPEGLEDLPPDGVLGGFDNATAAQQPSDVRVERWQRAAQAWAELLTSDPAHLQRVLNCPSWATDDEQQRCVESFFDGTARLIFRRALSDAERERFTSRFAVWQAAIDFEGAVQFLLEAMLQAPEFLYRPELEFDGRARATRLAMLLWDSAPDDALLRAAEHGQLGSVEEIRFRATRMLADPRAQRTWWNFHRQWLALDRVLLDEHQVRTPEVDPSWTTATQHAALDETRRFVEHTLTEDHTLGALLTSQRAWLDAESSRLYGVPQSQTTLEGRAGVLTRLAFLAGQSHRGATSPPVRGNAIFTHLLCRQPTPPPPGIDTTPPVAQSGVLTNRQAFEQRTSAPACFGCHRGLNGLGFGFEGYNAAGVTQTIDQGLPVDPSGTLWGTDVDGPFDGGVELSSRLAQSAQVQRCATTSWVRYALGREPTEAEQPWVDATIARFVKAGGDEQALLLDLVTSRAVMNLESP